MNIRKLYQIVFALFSILLTFPQAANSQALPDGVSIHMLDNGMQVLLIENPALPMVGVNVVVKVGSAYESFATSGMSHMLEHLLFNGSTTRTQKELYDDTDRIGGYNNANTSDYFTNFMMVTPAENIEKGMDLQADMLFRSVLPEEKFQKEKGIVLEEISKSLANADEQVERNTISLLYKNHALSLPTLGTYATIKAMDRDQVFEFYKNNYVPNNMIMSVVGNFESGQMLKTINEIYGSEAPGEVYRDNLDGWAVGYDALSKNITISGKEYHRFYSGEQEQVQFYFPICYKKPSAFYELLELKLKEINKDLEEELKARFPEAIQSSAMQTRQTPVAAALSLRINLKDEIQIDDLSKFLTSKLTKIDWQYSPVLLNTEIAKARTTFLKNIEKPHMFGIYNAYEFATGGIEAVLASYNSDTYQQAGKNLQTFKVDSDPFIIYQHPEQVAKDETGVADNAVELFESNGQKPTLIIKQNSASPLLAMHYILQHKAPLESEFGKDAAEILHGCFGKRLESEENQKISSAFGLSAKVNDNPFIPMDDRYMNPDYGYIRFEALGDDIPAVIGFLNNQMLRFKPTQAEYQEVVAKMKRPNPMMMMGGGDQAKKMFKAEYQSLAYEDNPYPKDQDIPEYEQLLKFAKKYFTPSNMIISVVSPEKPESVNNLFNDFSNSTDLISTPVYSKQIRLQTEPILIDKPGGGKRSYLFWGFSKEILETDKAALKALSLILNEKIVFDIREKQGLAYHMSAGIEVKNDRALFYINQGTMPANVDKLLPQYETFFTASMLKDLSEDDFQKAINMYLGRVMFRHLSSINQGYFLGYGFYFHNDINYDNNAMENLKKVQLEDVRRVAKKYLIVQNPITVVIR